MAGAARQFWSTRSRRLMMAASAMVLLLAASGVQAETLQDALVAAYNTNPQLSGERARLRATDENVAIARSGWRPTVTLTGAYGYTERRATPSFSPTRNTSLHPLSGSVVARQPLFRGDSFFQIKQAKAEVRAGKASLAAVEQNVLLATVTAYMDVLRDQSLVELNRNNVEVLKRQLSATRDRFEVGELTRTDVAQAEARLGGAISALTEAEAQLTRSRQAYERVVGQKPGTLEQPPALPPLPATPEEGLAVALSENPNLVAAREQEVASRLAVAVAKAGLLPQINFRASFEHNEENSTPASQADEQSYVAEMTWPLYQGGAEYARVRQARQNNSRSLMAIAQTERETAEGFANAWELLRASRAKIQSDQEQVRANEIAYEGVRQEALVGSRTTLDVLDAEQELLNARASLVGSIRNEYVAGYQLLSAIGRLSAESLGLPVDRYDPDKYYRKVNHKFIGWDTRVRGEKK